MVFKSICLLVLCTKVALAFEGLMFPHDIFSIEIFIGNILHPIRYSGNSCLCPEPNSKSIKNSEETIQEDLKGSFIISKAKSKEEPNGQHLFRYVKNYA